MAIKYAWKDKRQYDHLEKGLTRYLHRARVNVILQSLEKIKLESRKDRMVVVDLGCGDGVLTKYLAGIDGFQITGIDSDPGRLKKAEELCRGKNITFKQGELRDLTMEESSVDVILLHHVLEHIDDDMNILERCAKFLKRGGYLILGIPNEDSICGRISRFLHKRLYEKGEHVNFYSEKKITGMLREKGFEIGRIGRIGFLFPVYYLHMALIANPVTFKLGDLLTKLVRFSADSLIIVAKVRKER